MRMSRYSVRLALPVALVLLSAPRVHAGRAIPDDNLSYPVLITLDGERFASGFYLQDGAFLYLVTARHALFADPPQALRSKSATLLSYPSDHRETGRILFRADLEGLQQQGFISSHPTHDVAIIRLATMVKSGDQGKQFLYPSLIQLVEAAPSGLLAASISGTKTFAEVLTANEVFIFGYPKSLGFKALPQIDYDRPLLRKGIVAGKNRKHKTIILDCPIYRGNSGGPVLEVEQAGPGNQRFRIIGVVSQFVPFAETWVNTSQGYSNIEISNSGYSVVTPMDMVLELVTAMRQAVQVGAAEGPGRAEGGR